MEESEVFCICGSDKFYEVLLQGPIRLSNMLRQQIYNQRYILSDARQRQFRYYCTSCGKEALEDKSYMRDPATFEEYKEP